MTTRRVLLATITAGFAGGLLVWFFYTHYAPSQWGDFDQVWLGSRALLAGRDPYLEVPKHFPWPLYYPDSLCRHWTAPNTPPPTP